TITAILDSLHIQVSSAQTLAGGTALTFGSISSLSGNSNLVLNGGVLEMNGTFTRALGAGAGQVQWASATAAGGFAASSSPLTVNIGGGTPLVFGTASFTSGALLLGSSTALADVTIVNPINLGGGSRTITTQDNGNTTTDFATLSGVISGSAASSLTYNGS